MEPKKIIDLESLEEISGGAEGKKDFIQIRMDVYWNDSYVNYVRGFGLDTTSAESFRDCIKTQYQVNMENVHIYTPAGNEIDYYKTIEQNGVRNGMVLKAVITG